MASEGEGPLARWSRLKRQARAGDDGARGRRADDATPPAPSADSGPPAAAAPAPPTAPDLPAIETLTAASDFRPFLAAEVPVETHRAALRALWQSDPILTAHDGLTDFAEDYHAADRLAPIVRTAYQVGLGYGESSDDPQSGGRDPAAPGPDGSGEGAPPAVAEARGRAAAALPPADVDNKDMTSTPGVGNGPSDDNG